MRKLLILFGILSLAFQESGTKLQTVVGKTTYPFWIQVPDSIPDAPKPPLLLFLHGRSLSGTNLNRVKRYGVLRAIERGRKIDAVVVAPQLASGPWNPDKVLELVDYVQQNYNTDPNRVYVCGMSLGGYGTLHFAGKYPERVAAAVAICGGGNTTDGCNLAKIPLWIQHGSKDRAVKPSESKKIYQAIKKCDPHADVTLTIIRGGTHGSVENLFHKDALYHWLFKHHK